MERWYDAYHELARMLKTFRDGNLTDSGRVLFERCVKDKALSRRINGFRSFKNSLRKRVLTPYMCLPVSMNIILMTV